jgi:hypothetical protein
LKYRSVTLYPLVIMPRRLELNSEEFFEYIGVNNFPNNIVQIDSKGETKLYTMIGDKLSSSDTHIIQGRFILFNKRIMSKIKLNPPQEEPLKLDPNEFLEEETYFLLDITNGVLLAEYNPGVVNVLSGRIKYLLNNILFKFRKINIADLEAIPVENFIEKIKDRAQVHKIKISLSWANLDYLENIGISSRKLKAYGENIEVEVTQIVKFRMPRIVTGNYIDKLRETKNSISEVAKSFKIYTDEGNFDLMGKNFVYYEINLDGTLSYDELKDSFHKGILDKYVEIQKNLLHIIRNYKTLLDY